VDLEATACVHSLQYSTVQYSKRTLIGWHAPSIFIIGLSYSATYMSQTRSSLKTGPARPGHGKIALVITAVDFDQFSLY